MKVIFPALWVAWLAAFMAIEFTALGTGHPEYTLSEYVWKLEQINQAWTFVRFFVIAFCLWLLLHMGWGLFR